MGAYSTGTVAVTNGSAVVTGTGTLFATAGAAAGMPFSIAGSGVVYNIASVDSETQVTLTGNYAASTDSGLSYIIGIDSTPTLGFALPNPNDLDATSLVKTALGQVEAAILGAAVPSASESVEGTTELATQAEVNTGTDTTRVLTPATHAAYVGHYNPNILINGDFQVWQRGTSFANANGYTVDRWYTNRGGGVAGMTVSRQDGDAGRYCMRLQRDSGNTSTADLAAYCGLETSDSIPAQGGKITISYRIRCGANFSPTSSQVSVSIRSGAHVDVSPFSISQNKAATIVATTSWQDFEITTDAVIPNTHTQLGVWVAWTPTGTAGADDWLEIEQVKMEIGDTATEFVSRHYAEELSLCQRYFCKSTKHDVPVVAGLAEFMYGNMAAWSGINLRGDMVYFPVSMRSTPTLTTYASSLGTGNLLQWFNGSAWANVTSQSASPINEAGFSWSVTVPAVTSFYSYLYTGNFTADAEL